MTQGSLLIGDIGGTNARFALATRRAPGFGSEMTLQCADFASAQDAISHYIDASNASQPAVICLAAAGPVVAQKVHFTNNHWQLDETMLAAQFPGSAVRLLNDFEAIAHSIASLNSADLLPIGSPELRPLPPGNCTVGVVGPGTGLGAVGLKIVDGGRLPIAGEAGHIGFAPVTHRQIELLAHLREHYDRVSTERLVSGPGLTNIHRALGRVHGTDWPQRSAEEIFAAARNHSDDGAAEALQLFFEILGQAAGDFALAIGAFDGIYLGGGILPRYPELLANSSFRAGFENKGRCRAALEKVPTQLILHPNPGLLGAAVVAAEIA